MIASNNHIRQEGGKSVRNPLELIEGRIEDTQRIWEGLRDLCDVVVVDTEVFKGGRKGCGKGLESTIRGIYVAELRGQRAGESFDKGAGEHQNL